MAGLCGLIGKTDSSIETLACGIEGSEEGVQTSYSDDILSVFGADPSAQPMEAEFGNGRLWVWGELYGFNAGNRYHPRPFEGESAAQYLGNLVADLGLDAIGGLNGEFIAVVYNLETGTVSLCTDRLSIRDTYFTRLSDQSIAFSTKVQTLSRLREVTPEFDVGILTEYLTLNRTFGLRTPLRGTHLVPPGSILSVDTESGQTRCDAYWAPVYNPRGRPFSAFVDEFIDRYRAAIADRTRSPGRIGVLLSGGSDSRLILAGLKNHANVVAFHMHDWMNPEAKIAERVASTADVRLKFLNRDLEYHPRMLRTTPEISNFSGRFDQAHVEGFMDQIRSDVDCLYEGSSSNTLFRGHHLRTRSISIPFTGSLDLPLHKPMDTVEDYVAHWDRPMPSFLIPPKELRSVLSDNIFPVNGAVDHHGIRYQSPLGLFACSSISPRTNSHSIFMAQGIREHLSYRNPFLDNRLIDLALSIPIKYRYRRDIVNAALRQIDPDLAAIPHPQTGVPLTRHRFFRQSNGLPMILRRKLKSPPNDYFTWGSFQNIHALIREHPFVENALEDHKQTIQRSSFLDWDGLMDCYEDHIRGNNHGEDLYRLLTLLEMPVTNYIINRN